MSAAVVPVKQLSAGKSRLSAHFARPQLEALCLAMLEDVVAALRDAESVDRVLVVTPDPDVVAAARRAGALALQLADPGLNASLDAASAALALGEGEPLLVVLGDVAGAQSHDIELMFDALAAQGGCGAVLAPASDGGSAALLRAPRDAIPSRFGPDSAKAHREAAARRGVPLRELSLPSLAIDLDCAQDLDCFLAAATGGRHTRAALRRLAWGGRP